MPREFKISKEVTLEATPEQVWDSIATEAGLAAWSMPTPVDPASRRPPRTARCTPSST
jgi:uncharacterized protein YndB with AHSA1/START domain